MTDFQFRLWVNLITYVDDFGRGDARPAIIKGSCFPLRDRITSTDISKALAALAGIGCISLYDVDGKSYLCFPNWQSHQNIRNQKSRYPAPPEKPRKNEQLNTIDCNCEQLNSIDYKCSRNPIQSESESESESEGVTRTREAPARHKYGQYDNVLLSDEDLSKLQSEFPTDWKIRIERLSEYMASTGKSYKSHLATIRAWARKDAQQPNAKPQSAQPVDDIDELRKYRDKLRGATE